MVYFELINKEKNNSKFWEIENLIHSKPSKVVVRYGKIGSEGITKEFIYYNDDWGEKYMKKQIELKLKKGYVQKVKMDSIPKSFKIIKTPKKSTIIEQKNIDYKDDYDFPNPKSFKKTVKGYSYYDIDINVNCYFKGTEPSPKGRGLCARAVLNNQRAYGKDGNVWIKKGNRWVNDDSFNKPLQIKTKKVELVAKKTCPPGKILSPKGRCIIDRFNRPLQTKTKKVKLVVKKTCPPGKILSPKGRCVIDRSNKPLQTKTKKVKLIAKKTCPPGKILSPKGRCVIDRSTKPKKVKLIVKKTCPPGKVFYQPLDICILDKSKPKNISKPTKQTKKGKLIVKKKSVELPKGKVLYDVKKQGVMLAHTFKDPKTGKIKSAPKGSTQAPNGWFLSEKYDGYRAIWNGSEFVSRNGNIFPTPPDFKKWLPTNVSLDGELFMGRDKFQQCGLFRKKEVDFEAWEKANVTYQIFDSPTMTGMFEERTSKIQQIIKEQCRKFSDKCPLIMTKQIKVKNEIDVYKQFDKLVNKGAEGVMLRAPNSPYDKKRSNYLLKVKQLFDAECKIIGYKLGSGKYKDMLGAFECELVKNNKIRFTISGMDDLIRQNYKKTHPLGTIVTFTYMGLSDRGVPRHPNYLRKRDKE